MKLPSTANNLLKNKYVLYIVFFFAFANVLGYLSSGDFVGLVLFCVVALLISSVNKNMIVILGGSLLLTNFVLAVVQPMGREGFNDAKGANDDNVETKPELEVKKRKNGPSDLPDTEYTCSPDKKDGTCPEGKSCGKEGTCVQKENKAAMTNLNPSRYPEADDVPLLKQNPGPKVDGAATLEGAYKNIESHLGSGGMSRLNDDTKDIMRQQKDMMGVMNNMGPMLDKADGLLARLGGDGSANGGLLNKLTNMQTQLNKSGDGPVGAPAK